MLNQTKIEQLEQKYDTIKKALGNKLAECRQFAGYPKRTYPNSVKSANILFKHESGENLPNLDTLEYYIELYQVGAKDTETLYELQKYGKEVKKEIIRQKRGWE